MGTTAGGLPYPEPTDPVAAGADAIKALAVAVDGKYTALDPAIKQGYGFITGTSAVAVSAGRGAILFGASFQVTPVVMLTNANAGAPCIPQIESVTTTGVNVYLFGFGAPPSPVANGTYSIAWVAIGRRV